MLHFLQTNIPDKSGLNYDISKFKKLFQCNNQISNEWLHFVNGWSSGSGSGTMTSNPAAAISPVVSAS
jgi:hypothetical protein